jgi:hypothetical protein
VPAYGPPAPSKIQLSVQNEPSDSIGTPGWMVRADAEAGSASAAKTAVAASSLFKVILPPA